MRGPATRAPALGGQTGKQCKPPGSDSSLRKMHLDERRDSAPRCSTAKESPSRAVISERPAGREAGERQVQRPRGEQSSRQQAGWWREAREAGCARVTPHAPSPPGPDGWEGGFYFKSDEPLFDVEGPEMG